MESFGIDISKDFIRKVKEETNLILYEHYNFGIKEMSLVNNILEGIENVKGKIDIV